MYATGSPAAQRSMDRRYAASASAPTGASGWATIAERSTPTAYPRSSSAWSRAVSQAGAVRRSMPSCSSVPTVLTAGSSGSQPDGDRDVPDLAQDLRACRPAPAVEQEVHRCVADAQVRERNLAEPFGEVRVE